MFSLKFGSVYSVYPMPIYGADIPPVFVERNGESISVRANGSEKVVTVTVKNTLGDRKIFDKDIMDVFFEKFLKSLEYNWKKGNPINLVDFFQEMGPERHEDLDDKNVSAYISADYNHNKCADVSEQVISNEVTEMYVVYHYNVTTTDSDFHRGVEKGSAIYKFTVSIK